MSHDRKSLQHAASVANPVLARMHERIATLTAELTEYRAELENIARWLDKSYEATESARAERDTALARIARAVAELEKALEYSGNRWSEWGDRAETVHEHVDAALEALR